VAASGIIDSNTKVRKWFVHEQYNKYSIKNTPVLDVPI